MVGNINLGLGSSTPGTTTSTGVTLTTPLLIPLVQPTATTGAGGSTVILETPVTGPVTTTLPPPSSGSTTTAGGNGTGATSPGSGAIGVVVTTPVLDGSVTVGGSGAGTGVDVTLGTGAAPTSGSGGSGGVIVTVGVGGSPVPTSGGSDPTGGHDTGSGGVGVVVTTPVVGGTVTVGGSGSGSGGGTGVGVTVGAGSPPSTGTGGSDAGGGGGTSTPTSGGGAVSGQTTPDAQSAYVNIFRLASTAEIPAAAQVQLDQLQQQVNTGAITAVQAVLKVADMAVGATAVAETSYQFFSGLTPTADGLSFLVHSPANATDLSDSYYTSFNLENRYINFASNLGLHSDYAPLFAQVYGAMSFQDAVATAYDRIVGNAQATAAGVDYKAAIADIVSRQPYFQAVAHERFGGDNQDLSVKLAAVAYIMEEAVRADVGRYGRADQNFLFDLADGHAQHHVDLVGTYGTGGPTNMTTS